MNDLADIPMREFSGSLQKPCGSRTEYCIKIPVFGGVKEINDFYINRARTLERRIKEAGLRETAGDRRMDGGFYPTYLSDRFLSVSGELYEDRGLMGDRLSRFSEIWDLRACRIVPLLSLAAFPRRLYRLMLEKTGEEMQRLDRERPGSFYHIPLPFYDGAFLTEDGIAWWYRRGRIAPGCGGIPTFTLMREKAAPHLIFEL